MNSNLEQNFQYVMPADEEDDYADDDHDQDLDDNEMEDDEAVPTNNGRVAHGPADDSDEANENILPPSQQLLDQQRSHEHNKMSAASHQ